MFQFQFYKMLKKKFFCYLSTYWWHNACLAVSRLLGSITRSALIKSFASVGASASNSSILGLELIDFVGWFKSVEPKPFPTDFKSLSLGTGKADKIHSILTEKKNETRKKFACWNINKKYITLPVNWVGYSLFTVHIFYLIYGARAGKKRFSFAHFP